jgi:phosphatidylinositol-3-phosphatase
MGALLENYYGIGHASAANYVAEVSGQAPSLGTQADCPVWIPFAGDAVAGPYHQALGEGCLYPPGTPPRRQSVPPSRDRRDAASAAGSG